MCLLVVVCVCLCVFDLLLVCRCLRYVLFVVVLLLCFVVACSLGCVVVHRWFGVCWFFLCCVALFGFAFVLCVRLFARCVGSLRDMFVVDLVRVVVLRESGGCILLSCLCCCLFSFDLH